MCDFSTYILGHMDYILPVFFTSVILWVFFIRASLSASVVVCVFVMWCECQAEQFQ